uniref:EGF-like domain-containing protein n=1 Tax=Globodera pallida TaxID=36090 RepID=A0A183BIM3_GLOPA
MPENWSDLVCPAKGPDYCRKTLCKSGNGKEWNTWGCYMNNDGPDCESRSVGVANDDNPGGSDWQCECSFGEKHEEMAFTLPPTPAPVTTTTKKPTKAPKPTTTTTKPSKGRRFVAEVPLALGLPMLLGILPFFHDMFAMLYGYHIN